MIKIKLIKNMEKTNRKLSFFFFVFAIISSGIFAVLPLLVGINDLITITQLMLIPLIVILPVSLYFLLREHRIEDIVEVDDYEIV